MGSLESLGGIGSMGGRGATGTTGGTGSIHVRGGSDEDGAARSNEGDDLLNKGNGHLLPLNKGNGHHLSL